MRTTANTARPILALALLLLFTPQRAGAQEHLVLDAHAATTPFPHFWEQTFRLRPRHPRAARRATATDLRTVKQATDFQFIRFHGNISTTRSASTILDRKTRRTPASPRKAANDAFRLQLLLRRRDLRCPPRPSTSDPSSSSASCRRRWPSDPNLLHAFWYQPNVSPPKDYAALGRDDHRPLPQHLVQPLRHR
jgi:xylan 1,4-beta-xylosidase